MKKLLAISFLIVLCSCEVEPTEEKEILEKNLDTTLVELEKPAPAEEVVKKEQEVAQYGSLRSEKPQHIVDHYLSLPPEAFGDFLGKGGVKYDLRYENGAWVWPYMDETELREAEVDLRNGFLEILDEGTGGGVVSQQLALYLDGEGNQYVGMTQKEFDGIFTRAISSFFGYSEKQNLFVDASQRIPDLRYDDFLVDGSAFSFENINVNSLEELVYIYIEYPRQGTTAMASIDISKLYYPFSKERYPEGSDTTEIQGIRNDLLYGGIELRWNKQEGRFTKGGKIVEGIN